MGAAGAVPRSRGARGASARRAAVAGRYLSGLAGAAEADDLLQDVLVIVVRRLGTLDDPRLFRPWAFRIASREAFRLLDIPLGTVKSRLGYGLRAIRKRLKASEAPPRTVHEAPPR